MFNVIPDEYVIIRSKGVFRQSKLYVRDNRIYAGHGSGFIRLTKNGTSVPTVYWDEISIDPLYDKLDRMIREKEGWK